MKKLIMLLLLVSLSSLSYSQSNLKSTDPNSFYVEALYKHIVKANQAYIEVKHRRTQIDSLQSILGRKNVVINSLIFANKLAIDRNKDYQDIFKAQQVKLRGCEDLQKKYDTAYKNLRMREGFMKIGTPVIVVSVAVLAGVGGYYIAKAVK